MGFTPLLDPGLLACIAYMLLLLAVGVCLICGVLMLDYVMPAVGIMPVKWVRPMPGINPGMLDQSRLELPGLDISPAVWVCAKRIPDLVADHGLTGWPGVMAAVIYQAKIDAKTGDIEAANWLAGDQCADYCYALGFDHAGIKAWVNEQKGIKKGNRVRAS